MCTNCNKPKQAIKENQNFGLDWLDSLQRIWYANKTANNPTEQQEAIALQRLAICSTCENVQISKIVSIANDFILNEEATKRTEPHCKKQCGLCGCSCVLLAYDQLVNSKPCEIGKF